jgi:dipeptidyl aminopeptidase/acylaminoacyl peptidase
MFEYFPVNYVWNLGVVATLNSGGLIDEVDRACRPIKDLAAQGADVGTREFMASWAAVAEDLASQAAADEAAGHTRTAGQKYQRATNYLAQAERMQSAKSPDRRAFYQRLLDLQQKAFDLIDPATTRVAIPFEGSMLPAYFKKASDSPAPTIILWNGLDSTKEHMYASGFAHELAARGINTLMVDCPGSGEALRFHDLKSRVETEDWAAACVDYLLTRDDVVAGKIGLVGWSLGG